MPIVSAVRKGGMASLRFPLRVCSSVAQQDSAAKADEGSPGLVAINLELLSTTWLEIRNLLVNRFDKNLCWFYIDLRSM